MSAVRSMTLVSAAVATKPLLRQQLESHHTYIEGGEGGERTVPTSKRVVRMLVHHRMHVLPPAIAALRHGKRRKVLFPVARQQRNLLSQEQNLKQPLLQRRPSQVGAQVVSLFRLHVGQHLFADNSPTLLSCFITILFFGLVLLFVYAIDDAFVPGIDLDLVFVFSSPLLEGRLNTSLGRSGFGCAL